MNWMFDLEIWLAILSCFFPALMIEQLFVMCIFTPFSVLKSRLQIEHVNVFFEKLMLFATRSRRCNKQVVSYTLFSKYRTVSFLDARTPTAVTIKVE